MKGVTAMSVTATSASKVASVPTLSELEAVLESTSPDGPLKSIKRFAASFVAKAFTLAEARAKLAFATTRSGNRTVAKSIHIVYGAYLCASVEGLSPSDALAYVTILAKSKKSDISEVEAAVLQHKTITSVLEATERLLEEAKAKAPVEVLVTPLTEFSMGIATSATKAKVAGISLEEALAEGAKAIRANFV